MEAFSTQGNGTMTIVKEKSPTSFEVEQNLKMAVEWRAHDRVRPKTAALRDGFGACATAAPSVVTPPPTAGRGAIDSGSFTIIMVGIK
jgi:hypothetical protein